MPVLIVKHDSECIDDDDDDDDDDVFFVNITILIALNRKYA